MYQGCPARHKTGTVRTTSTNATYASTVTASAATYKGSVITTTGNGRIDDEGSTASTVPEWRLTGDDNDNCVAKAVVPDRPGTFAAPAPTEGTDDLTETSQSAVLVEPQKRM